MRFTSGGKRAAPRAEAAFILCYACAAAVGSARCDARPHATPRRVQRREAVRAARRRQARAGVAGDSSRDTVPGSAQERMRRKDQRRRFLLASGVWTLAVPPALMPSAEPPVLHESCTRPAHVKALASRYDAAATCSNSTTGGCTDTDNT